MTTINVPLDLQKMAIDFVSLMHAELFNSIFFFWGGGILMYTPAPVGPYKKQKLNNSVKHFHRFI